MALDNHSWDGNGDIAQFLEKFKEQNFPSEQPVKPAETSAGSSALTPAQYERSFEKLEQKIQELEQKFEASSDQNQQILSELSRTREVVEQQQSRDAFVENLSRSIANLKASVENLSRAQQDRSFAYREPDVQRSFDSFPRPEYHTDLYHYEPENYRAYQEERQRLERQEKERIIASLHQKASQLKAVNSALDREIKKVQQEKWDALKKSAEQAKEILSLRHQLTAAEERFKSFNFEGRIISIRQEYEQRVNSLETQLKEMSDTCMQQVEEIEALRAENIKLHKAVEEKEKISARLEAKERELASVQAELAALRADRSQSAQKQVSVFTQRIGALEIQRDELSIQFQNAQNELESVRSEKELLEKNFKELVSKINSNDQVIEQLKHKIEVLGRQNEELSQRNARLQEENVLLSGEKQVLAERSEEAEIARDAAQEQIDLLAQQNKEITFRTEQLERDKESFERQISTLTGENATLSEKAHALLQQAEVLSDQTQQLSDENQQLRSQSAALLAARLVQEKEQTVQKKKLSKISKKPLPPTAEMISAASLQKQGPVAVHAPAVADTASENKSEETPAQVPLEIAQKAKAPVLSEEDLPEIRVADPIPQPDPLFDGEDFLEKTDSFIGRIKWSLFREDK